MNSTPTAYQDPVRPEVPLPRGAATGPSDVAAGPPDGTGEPRDVATDLRETRAEQVGSGPALPERRGARSGDRLYVLDLLRFGAAMMVVGFHLVAPSEVWGADTATLFTHTVTQFFRYGWIGVEFFFVISGFVICMSGWGRTLSEFFVSRVTRLMPMYVLAVLLTSAVVLLGPPPGNDLSVPQILANLTMVQSLLDQPSIDTVYWTLFVELKFYLLFAVVVAVGATYRRVLLFCAMWTVVALFAQATETRLLQVLVEPLYAPYFVVGVTLYLIHRFGPSLLLWATLGMSAILCAVSLTARVDGRQTHYAVALALFSAFLLIMVAIALGWFSWLRWRGLVTIGLLTYPVYLLHQRIGQLVIREFRDLGMAPWLLLGTIVIGVLLLAAALNVIYERPVARMLRDRLRADFARVRAEPTRR
ncbi:acyltransferase family protein [Micromonospora sp. NPDC050397]|uniref:acyltransferase family protein n=1 Tax=Micromonospora sp. NPDC050397 TaxID=3364279 RepID=UPI00384A4C92